MVPTRSAFWEQLCLLNVTVGGRTEVVDGAGPMGRGCMLWPAMCVSVRTRLLLRRLAGRVRLSRGAVCV